MRASFGAALEAIGTALILVACGSDGVGVDGNSVNQNANENVNRYVGSVLCGNGIVDTGEVCDDGNNISGDGCSADCCWDPVVLASGQGRPSDIAVDATHVYWTNPEAGTVMKVRK